MDCSLVYVNGHVEVFDNQGKFMFSADNEMEARYEMKHNDTQKIGVA